MAARVREVVWAESARDTLEAVVAYMAQDSPQAAARFLDDTLRVGTSLTTLAERGRVVPELNDPVIREVLVHKYRLLYEVGDERVLIVAFLHGARDFATWQKSVTRD